MKLNPNSSPETVPDDQKYEVSRALKEKARLLDLESSQHTDRAEYFREHGVDQEIVAEEESQGLEFLARIKRLRWVANILNMSGKNN